LNAGLINAQKADQIRKLMEKTEDSEIRFLEGFIQEKAEVKRKGKLAGNSDAKKPTGHRQASKRTGPRCAGSVGMRPLKERKLDQRLECSARQEASRRQPEDWRPCVGGYTRRILPARSVLI
jgi:hypothetical protein